MFLNDIVCEEQPTTTQNVISKMELNTSQRAGKLDVENAQLVLSETDFRVQTPSLKHVQD